MQNTVCPICRERTQSTRSTLFEITKSPDKVYLIVKCRCGMVYTHYEHHVEPAELYDQNDYTVRDTRNSIFFRIQKWEYGHVIENIKKITAIRTPQVLDFGSGKGLFMHFASTSGCQVKGIESSKPRAEYARDYFGLEVNTDYYSSGNVFNMKFDTLTTFHVLEHLENPAELLGNLVKYNLKPGGLLIAEVPNFNSWQSAWAGKHWLHLDVPRHIGHFTDETLTDLFNKTSSTIIKKEYFSMHLGVIGMMQSIFSWFGYKGFLIAELKEKKHPLLLLKVVLALPFAVILEGIASLVKKGGVIRYYAIYEPAAESNQPGT